MKKILFENKNSDNSSESEEMLAENGHEIPDSDSESAPLETLVSENKSDNDKRSRRPGMVKLQKIMIVSFLSVAVVMSVLYFAWLRPMMKELSNKETDSPPVLIEGEAYTTGGNGILMFPHIEMKNIKSIEIHNEYDDFNCVKADGDNNDFVIVEHPQVPIDIQKFTSFAVNAGYTVATRLKENCDDFALYGLGQNDTPAYFKITDVSGNSHTVYIGDELKSGGGYYARYDGRNAVYILASGVADSLLSPATSLISPMLGYAFDENSALKIDNVMMYKNGQPFIYVNYTETPDDDMALSAYVMKYPANYMVNDDHYGSVMLASFAGGLKGYTVLEAGTPGNRLIENEEIMSEYGFFDVQNMPYELYYYAETPDGAYLSSAIAFTPAYISDNADYYIAYSYLYDMIVLIEKTTVSYLEKDLLYFIDNSLFSDYITNVKEISVTGALRYNGSTYKIDERFGFSTDKNSNLTCYAYSTEKTFTGNRPANNPVQGFYGTVLAMKAGGYIKSESVDIEEIKKTEYASLTVEKNNGEKTVYKFYRYSQRCYYTVDGEGEFYISLTQVNKLLVDAVRAANGFFVDSNAENAELPNLAS